MISSYNRIVFILTSKHVQKRLKKEEEMRKKQYKFDRQYPYNMASTTPTLTIVGAKACLDVKLFLSSSGTYMSNEI